MKRFFKFFGLVLIVVGLSIVSTLAVLKYNAKTETVETSKLQVPNAYANFTNASSALETDFTAASELSIDAVVHVKTKTKYKRGSMRDNSMDAFRDPFFEFFFGQPRQRGGEQAPEEIPMQEGVGSGVIITDNGYIVTNNHVIKGADEIEITLNDKRSFTATVVGADPSTDLALLKIEAEKLPIIVFGNSDNLKVGEWVLAVGNPFNLTSTVTAGIVSAKARNINMLDAELKIEAFIQTDAAVNPGNSGGALVNTRGELVGINTAIASRNGSFSGYSFAIPSSIVSKVVADIRQFGAVQRAILGVEIRDIDNKLAKEKNLERFNGAYVAKVREKSSAEKAGIKEADIIYNVNGAEIKSVAELQEQIGRYRPGDIIYLEVLRDKKSKKIQVELKNQQGTTKIVSTESVKDVLGASFKKLDEKTLESLKIRNGLQVSSISKGKLQSQGVKKDYIILRINNQTIKTEEDLKRIVDNTLNKEGDEKVLFVTGIYPNGKVAYYAIDLAE